MLCGNRSGRQHLLDRVTYQGIKLLAAALETGDADFNDLSVYIFHCTFVLLNIAAHRDVASNLIW